MTKSKTEQPSSPKLELNYNQLLDRLYMSLPQKAKESVRYEMPTAISMIQGKQTIWKNFIKCAKDLDRDQNLLYKFVMKEISTSSTIVNNQALVLNGAFDNQKINLILEKFINAFVLCSECKKPDTTIITQHNIKVLKCSACGAISALPKL